MGIMKVKSEKEEEEDDGPVSVGLEKNILSVVGTVGILGIFFAMGALLFTFYEDWWGEWLLF